MLIELYAAMAQVEVEKKEKRQREGIDVKKARGDWGIMVDLLLCWMKILESRIKRC